MYRRPNHAVLSTPLTLVCLAALALPAWGGIKAVTRKADKPTAKASEKADHPSDREYLHYSSVADGYAANRPLAWWRLKELPDDKQAIDVLGKHHGKLRDGAPWFDGEKARVEVGTLDIDSKHMSLLAWFRADDFGTPDARIISKATGTNVADHHWMLSTVAVGKENNRKHALRFRLKAGDKTAELIAKGQTLKAASWVFAAATYDGKRITIYQNGTPAGSMKKTGRINTNSHADVWIGDNPSGVGSRSFDGKIENVALFDHALTQDQIKAIFTASLANLPRQLAQAEPKTLEQTKPTEKAKPKKAPRNQPRGKNTPPTKDEPISTDQPEPQSAETLNEPTKNDKPVTTPKKAKPDKSPEVDPVPKFDENTVPDPPNFANESTQASPSDIAINELPAKQPPLPELETIVIGEGDYFENGTLGGGVLSSSQVRIIEGSTIVNNHEGIILAPGETLVGEPWYSDSPGKPMIHQSWTVPVESSSVRHEYPEYLPHETHFHWHEEIIVHDHPAWVAPHCEPGY